MTHDLTARAAGLATGVPAPASRLASLDLVRGGIIVLMAIDHARGFMARNHPAEFWGSSLPDYQGDWLAFVTRLVTHVCAPGFMFLMGAGAALFAASRMRTGWTPARITAHLVLRGLLLVVLGQLFENTAAAFASSGGPPPQTYGLRVPGAPGPVTWIFGVLYGLGTALAVAALLMRLPSIALAAIAAACVLVTHWLTPDAARAGEPIAPLMGVLVLPGLAPPVLCVYPTIPWLGPT
ncbi:MAG TPA: heparan-alpha-glucosaminide N-acetyltransferase domain-containing protein, partial [Vicinamibacterales bacterium]